MKPKNVHIYHHLGLGDHIICNSIVRNYAKESDNILLFVKPHNYSNVKFMFRDIPNIDYIVADDQQANVYIAENRPESLVTIGFEYCGNFPKTFDELFYDCVGIPFEKRFQDFYIQRDLDAEEELINRLNPNNEPYIFLHEDLSRGHKVDRSHILNKDLRIIESNFDFNDPKKIPFFHYISLIEQAQEVHVMESSYKALIDSVIEKKDNMFLYVGVKGDNNWSRSYNRSNWNLIF